MGLGDWWIPLLILFGIWKHGVCRVPITYTPMLWSLVFPLGMYALASLRLSLASDFPPLRTISLTMVWVALAVWAATSAGLVVTMWKSWRRFSAASAPSSFRGAAKGRACKGPGRRFLIAAYRKPFRSSVVALHVPWSVRLRARSI